jgi:mRNA-degrading endonuclease RelE of RelBE toxin-antitoxin system
MPYNLEEKIAMFKELVKLGKTDKKRFKEYLKSEKFQKLMYSNFDEYKLIKEVAKFNGVWESQFK